MYRLGERELFLNPLAIAYFEESREHGGIVIVLVTGERIDAPERKAKDFARHLNGLVLT